MGQEKVFIGLGANLDQPQQQIVAALLALSALPRTQLIGYSSLYSSKPLGPQEQPDYVNAVAMLDTQLAPLDLLDWLQDIEKQHGRVRKEQRWGARTLDLDIILFGTKIVQSERLTIPHYHFQHREFVLYPLFELAPDLVLPDGQSLTVLLESVPENGLSVMQHHSEIALI